MFYDNPNCKNLSPWVDDYGTKSGIFVFKKAISDDLIKLVEEDARNVEEKNISYENGLISWYEDKALDPMVNLVYVWDEISNLIGPEYVIHPMSNLLRIKTNHEGYYKDSDTGVIVNNDINIPNIETLSIISSCNIDNNVFNGFIVKQNPEFIYNKNYQPELKYFSVDTNTIYPPALQISWDDSVWNTGSSTQTVLNNLPAVITLAQNPGVFYSQSVNIFRVNAAPEYPPAVWQTSSLYTQNYYLPQNIPRKN